MPDANWKDDYRAPCGGSVTDATILRAIGMTTSMVGNAKAHDHIHDVIQVETRLGADAPKARKVEMPDTMQVIRNVKTSGNSHAAERAGSFDILALPFTPSSRII